MVNLVDCSVDEVRGVRDKSGAFLGILSPSGDVEGIGVSVAGPLNKFSALGDSRTQDIFVASPHIGKSSRSWLVWAMAYYKQSFSIVEGYGVSGYRSDQYLTNGAFELALADGSGTLVFGFPVINDIAQSTAGYTDTYGTAITTANVVDQAILRIVVKINAAVAAGKSVIVLAEPGGTSLVAAQVALVHEFNRKYRDAIAAIKNVYWWNFNRIIWNATSSTTLIAFKANYSGDGTHMQQMAGRAMGKDFAANFLPSYIQKIDTANDNLSAQISNAVGQIYANPLLNVLTGGVTGSNITITSGTVPGSMTVAGSVAGALFVVITSAANADELGNDVTFAFTASAATTAKLDFTIPNAANLALTDFLECGVEYDVGAGSAANIYSENQMNSNSGTANAYDMYSVSSGPTSGLADSGVVIRSARASFLAGSASIGYQLFRLNLAFPASGTATITVRRPFINRYR